LQAANRAFEEVCVARAREQAEAQRLRQEQDQLLRCAWLHAALRAARCTGILAVASCSVAKAVHENTTVWRHSGLTTDETIEVSCAAHRKPKRVSVAL
jgi:alkylation response protein AidB-like acyl-CoA dehydrogenase